MACDHEFKIVRVGGMETPIETSCPENYADYADMCTQCGQTTNTSFTEAFGEFYQSREWDILCDELYWSGGWDQGVAESVFKSWAYKNALYFNEMEISENEMYLAYRYTEKGLS